MALFKCKICGGALEIDGAQSVFTCEYCGTKQTLPRLDDERRANLYDRANHFRRNNDFDKAMGIFEQILMEEPTDAEAYWSIVLCRYGIEYVEDPATRRRVPTVNRAQFTSIFDDEDYKSAIANADGYQRELYEAEANAINELQKNILAISQKEEPFDVFICYKESDASGRRTKDSVLATELYHELTREGFKVFFARITLEDKLGQEYEPYIFAALNSAKVMVVLGTRPEHFNAVWVKNEWSRYLALIKNGARKALIPAYRDMDPYDLPEEFSHLQAQDMSKLGFMQDLVHGIKKMATVQHFDAPAPTKKPTEPIEATALPNIAPLLERAFLFLEDGDFETADEYCEKVLDQDPRNVRAYLGKLMVDMHVNKQEELISCGAYLEENGNYQKALRFADGEQAEMIKGYALQAKYDYATNLMVHAQRETEFQNAAMLFSQISDYKDASQRQEQCLISAEEARKEVTYQKGIKLLKEGRYMAAARIFEDIVSYQDAEAQAVYCREQHKETTYQTAIKEIEKNTSAGMEKAATLFASISGWRDAEAKAEECRQRVPALVKKEKLERKKGLIIGSSILGVILIALLIFAIYFNTVIAVEKDGVKYQKVDDTYHVVGYKSSLSDAIILSEIKGKLVTAIQDGAFYQCKNLKSVTIPSSVTSIGNNAFKNCTSLTNITIPDSVTSIETYAFAGCSNLTSITIPSSITCIERGTFFDCTNLTAVTIPSTVKTISPHAFNGCSKLASITIPSSVTSICAYSFAGCSGLVAVKFENTTGWRRSSSLSATDGIGFSSTDLANAFTAATYLKANYTDYYWTHTP